MRVAGKGKLPAAALIAILALLASCSSLQYLQSDNYIKARIAITTDRGSVSGMHLLSQWTIEFGPEYKAEDVGVMVANRLERQGWHDASILLEVSSWCNPPYRPGMEEQNTWRISVYRTPAQMETPAQNTEATEK
ncbi:MAG: hypothetical protein ABSG21_12260 [Spirochaetia bacterium]